MDYKEHPWRRQHQLTFCYQCADDQNWEGTSISMIAMGRKYKIFYYIKY